MKRYGNLWDEIVSFENIKYAHMQARKGKSSYAEVRRVDRNVDHYVEKIRQLLVTKSFTTSAYETETRFDGKKVREIHKLPYYPDRIIQHALLNVVEPILKRSLIRDTFQSIKGRGISDAKKRVALLVQSEDRPKYALKVDVSKFYPSTTNSVLKEKIRTKIKCKDTLWLIDDIVDSTKGLPIGNYTSQIFGNFYLKDFDWWMVQEVKPEGYFRYCDDIVIFDSSKDRLKLILKDVKSRLLDIYLTVKDNWIIYDVEKQGVDFVGYVFKPNSTRLRPSIAKKFKATARSARTQIRWKSGKKVVAKLMAYKGWAKQSNSKKLWRKHVVSSTVRHADKLPFKTNPLRCYL